jgi:hypothetical protein
MVAGQNRSAFARNMLQRLIKDALELDALPETKNEMKKLVKLDVGAVKLQSFGQLGSAQIQ